MAAVIAIRHHVSQSSITVEKKTYLGGSSVQAPKLFGVPGFGGGFFGGWGGNAMGVKGE